MFSRKSSKPPKIESSRSKSQKKSIFSRLTSRFHRFQTRKSRYPSIRESSIQLEPAINKEEIQKQIDNHKTKIEELKKIIDNKIDPEMTKLKEEFEIFAFEFKELYEEWFSNKDRNAREAISKKISQNSILRAGIVGMWDKLSKEKTDKNQEINSLGIEIEMLNKELKDNKSGGTRKRYKYKKHKKHKKH